MLLRPIGCKCIPKSNGKISSKTQTAKVSNTVHVRTSEPYVTIRPCSQYTGSVGGILNFPNFPDLRPESGSAATEPGQLQSSAIPAGVSRCAHYADIYDIRNDI